MDIFEEESVRYAKGLGDYHLRSALTEIPISTYEQNKGRYRELSCYKCIKSQFTIIGNLDTGRLLGEIMLKISTIPPMQMRHQNLLTELLETERLGLSLLNSTNDPMQRGIDLLKNENLYSMYTLIKEKFQLSLMYLCAKTSEREFKIAEKQLDKKGDTLMMTIDNFSFLLFGDLIGVCTSKLQLIENCCFLISLDCFRMLTDKLTERDNILLATNLGNKIMPEIYPTQESVTKIFSYFDNILKVTGNSGYQLLKAYEALVTGVILQLETSDFINTSEFLENTVSGLPADLRMYAAGFIDLLKSTGSTIHHYTQFLGLFRMWGHPQVESSAGIEKARKIGTASKLINISIVRDSGRKLKEILCSNYYSQKGVYPSLILTEHSNSYLLTQIEESAPFNIRDPGYTMVDWDFVEFSETFVSPKTFNLSMIVSDTAISPTRSENLNAKKQGKSATDPMIRRGVLKWMKDGMVDCDHLLQSINNTPLGLEKDDRIIGLYPKERELNPVPRMFALMSLKMRSYVVITENMLSDNILPLIPGITMTHSMLNLQKEMVRNTKSQSQASSDSVTFCINMDFEKWNLNMRKESTYEVFKSLGQLFGLPTLYNKTYDIFENSIIYLADGSYTLNLDDNLDLVEKDLNKAYSNHIGGFEGLRQKGWTIFTVVLIALVCDSMGIKYRLMGQGDNQVLIVTLYSHRAKIFGLHSEESSSEITATLYQLQCKLQEVFGSVGLPLKPLESWTSESFFSYGKFPIYRGVPCAMSLKKISRIFFFSNEDLMTIDNAMGSITSNAQSSVMADVHPIVSYIIAKWQHICCVRIFMKYHPLLGTAIRDLHSWVKFKYRTYDGKTSSLSSPHRIESTLITKLIVTIPKTLGGYNSINYFDVIMRGFTDPPSKDMTFLYNMCLHSLGEFQVALARWRNVVLNDQVDYVHLVQDPTSLNIFAPPNSRTIIKRMITETVRSLNLESEFSKWFFEVLEISDSDKIRELCNHLTSTPEVNIRFIHDFLGATLYGYSDSITSKVDKTVTLSRITLGQSRKDVVGALCKGEKRFWEYFEWRTAINSGEEMKTICPSAYVRYLRDKGWKKKIVATSTPFPFHYLSDNVNDTSKKDSFIEGYVSEQVLLHTNDLVLKCGNSLPYLGSITKEKVFSPIPRIAFGTEPLITRPLQLLRAIGWFIDDKSNWAQSLKSLLNSVTNLDPNDLIYIPDHIKGSMAHRYSDMATKHGSLWMPLFGPATHFHISTNRFSEYAKGSQNVTLHFQATLCMIQYLLLNSSLSCDKRKKRQIYRSCEQCITPIDDIFQDLSDEVPMNLIPSNKANPYLFVDAKDIFFRHKKELFIKQRLRGINFRMLSMDETLTRYLLEEIIANQTASSIMYGDNTLQGAFDLQSTSRTLYLKIDITRVINITVQLCFVILCEGERKRDFYPSWEYVKRRLLRRIQSSSPDNFLNLGGFFCWEELLNNYKNIKWVHLPQTYPISVSGVADCCKQSVVNYAQQMAQIYFQTSGILPCYILSNVSWLAKIKLLSKHNMAEPPCFRCYEHAMKTPLKFENQTFEISSVKCKEGHTIYKSEDFHDCSLYEGSIDSLSDLIPNRNLIDVVPDRNFNLFINPLRGEELITSLDVKFYRGTRSRPMLNFPIQKVEFMSDDLCMRWKYPTASAYRIYDLINSCSELKGDGGILMLGDGHGMSSSILKLCFPHRALFSWTLIDITSALPHSLGMSKPPTHYFLDVEINSEATISIVSDIRNPKFPYEFSNFSSKNGISTCICEIEIWYSGGEQSDCHQLIRCMWFAKINTGVIKLSITNICDLDPFLVEACMYYDNWRLMTTESCKISRGSCWLILRGRRLSINSNLRYLPLDSLSLLEDKIRYQLRYGMQGPPINYINRWFYLESMLWTTKLQNMIFNYINNWFCSDNLMGWDEEQFTNLFYNLKTGRRPIAVRHAHGNSAYYLYKSQENTLFIKLMALGLSLLRSNDEIMRVFEEDAKWKLTWCVSGESGSSRLTRHWHPEIIKDKDSVHWNMQSKKEIFNHIPIIQLFRNQLENPYSPIRVLDKISFRYVPVHKWDENDELFFPISKISSYKMGEHRLEHYN